ncbi:glycosyltransferase family 2 protein [Niveibacterium sp. SC-1]|uniref:glycosyltransferase family 2 protein n=1 Tax=Niveibacterium sp. SC-1 TaxID=3135646 RepID=UPI00311DA18E
MTKSGACLRRLLGIRLGVLAQHKPRPIAVATAHDVPRPAGSPELPSFTIVTPSLNQGNVISETVVSVIAQKYPRLQYLIQDGGSRDDTLEKLRPYESQVDLRIERDSGQADALNRAFRRASGDIFAYLNSDDILLPGALMTVATYFIQHPEVDVIYGNRLLIDANGQQIGEWDLPYHDGELLKQVDYIPQETAFWRRSAWEKAGGHFNQSLHFALDWEFFLRLQAAGARFAHIPKFLGAFRVHSEQKTQSSFRGRGVSEMRELRRQYGGTSATARIAQHVRHVSFLARHILLRTH